VITVRHGGATEDIADCLAVSGGWNPNVHLTCHMNARPVWDARTSQAFLPAPGAVPGLTPAGACNGVMSTAGCLPAGRDAAAALAALGLAAPDTALPRAEDAPYLNPLWACRARAAPGSISRTT
jgi:hypothetical protein